MPRDLNFYAWYPADYRADTRHLNRAEHFAYREILDEIFLSGSRSDPPGLMDDDAYLMRLCKAESAEEWAQTRYTLIEGPNPLLQRDRYGWISQRRLTAELIKARDARGKRQAAAAKRWEKPAPDRSGSTNGHGEVPEHGGNGHGAPTMSEAQFLFYAGKVAKWMDEKRDLYHGGSSAPGSAFARDFENSIGISWQRWLREQEMHQL